MSDMEEINASPLVTVAMPVYNGGQYLRLAVLSIIKQTFTDWEMLIIDDGSTDNAFQSISDIDDNRINILRDGSNKGLAARLNQAIDLARGQYLARMDADDVSYPERFERQVEVLLNDPTVDLVGARSVTINDNNELTGVLSCGDISSSVCSKPWRGISLPHPTWMGQITWFRKNRYAEPAPYFCEDQELLLRTYENSRFLIVNEQVLAYRISQTINWHKLVNTRKAVLKMQLKKFVTKGQLSFSIMALLSFIGRLSLDVLKRFTFVKYPVMKKQTRQAEEKWQHVLNLVTNKMGK